MIYRSKQSTVRAGDTTLRYIVFGKGTRPLVMLQGLNTNGIGGAADSLAFAYRIFAKDFKVYLFDRRPDVWEGITVRDLAADIAAAMDALHLSDACVLGVSQGGMIAQHLALDRPDLVGKLVLAVTLCENNDTVTDAIHTWVRLTAQKDFKTLVADMAKRMYSPAYLARYKPFLPLLTLAQTPKDKERFITLANSCLTCDTRAQLHNLTCPTLVIGGAQDKVVGADSAGQLADSIGCPLHLYPDLGHAAYEEAKDFNQIVYDFFTRNRA